jgi:hypothetical protein
LNNRKKTAAVIAGALLALVLAATAVAAAIAAVSTSLVPRSEGGECEWRENAFADEDAFLCPGAGGFKVYVRGAGVDTWPAFARGHEVSDLRAGISRIIGADVIALTGAPMEWRLAAGRPIAAIFQMRGESDAGGKGLVYIVARIAGDRVCIAGTATGDAAARRIADDGGGCR